MKTLGKIAIAVVVALSAYALVVIGAGWALLEMVGR